jgi:putative FmdB family regulatory protein
VPTYQYVCTECSSDLEAIQSFSDPSLTDCPTCGGKLRKRFGAVGVVFKGSGFYRNDSRSDSRRGAAERKSDGDKAAGNDGDKSAKTETKAESSGGSSAGGGKDAKSDSATKSTPAASGSGSSSSSSTAKASSAA